MDTVDQQLELARQHLRGDRLEEASAIAGQVLQEHPKHPRAAHLMATLCHKSGDLERALHWGRQAVAAKPDASVYHRTLGVILRALGRPEEAVACYQKCIELNAEDAIAYYNLGNLLRDAGDLVRAGACYEKAAQLAPHHANSHYNLAKLLYATGLTRKASARYRLAIDLKPDHVGARVDLASLLLSQNRPAEAAASCYQALRYDPDCVEAHNNLGNALAAQGKHKEAFKSYRRAIERDPRNARLWNNAATVLQAWNKLDAAAICFARAINLDPRYPTAHCNLGDLRLAQRDLNAAMASYDNALRINPDHAGAHARRAQLWLVSGDFERGWGEYPWRLQTRPQPQFQQPPWDGSPMPGRTLLLYTDDDLADTLQFIRYAARVKQQFEGTVALACQKDLMALLGRCPGIDRVLAQGDEMPQFDSRCAVASLPAFFHAAPEDIPADLPYLRADPDRKERWCQRLADVPGLKVGIFGDGQSSTSPGVGSIPVEQFRKLGRVAGIQLIELPTGPATGALPENHEISGRVESSKEGASEIVDLAPELSRADDVLADLAAVIENLDLVIAADSPLVHLVGALGASVWLALAYVPQWRWQLDRHDSPWYPTMRLFRQKEPGHWDGVFQQIRIELEAWVQTRKA